MVQFVPGLRSTRMCLLKFHWESFIMNRVYKQRPVFNHRWESNETPGRRAVGSTA